MTVATQTENYTQGTYQSPVAIKRWLHQKRFNDALRLLRLQPTDKVLDYGAGDGHFLEIAARQHDPSLLVGYEPAEQLLVQAQAKLAGSGVTVLNDLAGVRGMKFNKVVCMEVCEHLPDPELEELLSNVPDYMAAGASFMLSVPIESGLPALAKNAFRYLKYRNQGHDRLTWAVYFRTVLGLPTPRRSDELLSGLRYMYSHIGFDFRCFERRLASRFRIQRKYRSPANFLGSGLNNTIYYICTAR
jgi:SAM-dependent methyltransferase